MGATEGGESEKKHYLLFIIESYMYNEATSSEEYLSEF